MVTISTIIPTRNRPCLLIERAVRSVMAQTFLDWECLIVGDDTDPETVRLMAELTSFDSRFRFWNLPARERSSDPRERWLVSGAVAWNAGLAEARGDFRSYLADDDAYLPDHHAVLHAQAGAAAVTYGWSVLVASFGKRSSRIYGRGAEVHPYNIAQGSYLAHRSIDISANPAPGNEAWDAPMWRRVIASGVRFQQVEQLVHEYHAAPENLAFQGFQW